FRSTKKAPVTRSRRKRPLTLRPQMEFLEDRTAPAVYDLASVAGQSATINGALFTGATAATVSGSGVIDSFVRLGYGGAEQGYKTDARPYVAPNDAGTTATFNKSLRLIDLPVVVVNGAPCYEFVLDANQTDKLPYLSLDELRLYVANSSTLNGYDPT